MPIDYSQVDTGDYPDVFPFEDKGDTIIGDVVRARTHKFSNKRDDGTTVEKVNPVFDVVDDNGKTWSVIAGQVELKRLVAAENVQEGDRIKIVLTGRERTERGGTKKLFALKVQKGAAKTPAAPEPADDPDDFDDFGGGDWPDGEEPF